MKLQPVFYDRGSFITNTYNLLLVKPHLKYTVDRLSKNAIGGCKQAQISASGSVDSLFELVEYLRNAVEIYDDAGRVCWWGYVNEVQISTGHIRFGVSLDSMYNKTICYYGNGHNTATASDTDSRNTYGTRTGRVTMPLDDASQANAFRDAVLVRRKYPIPSITIESGTAGATIYCVGWWDMFDWGTYVDTDKGKLDTGTQIKNITAGNFSPITYIETATGLSGVTSERYRQGGTRSARDEIEDLLVSGTSNGKRMIAHVDINRAIHVKEEPVSTTDDYWIDSRGNISTYLGAPIQKYLVDAGQWVRLKDVVPATADVSKLADCSKIFLEEIEWSDGDQLRITPRDIPLDLDILKYGAQ